MKATALGSLAVAFVFIGTSAAYVRGADVRATPAAASAPVRAQATISGEGISGTLDAVEITTGTAREVEITLKVKGLKPGLHGVHLHAVGKCEPPFTSAGPHFNPAGHKHGMEAAEGPHAGDMPNLHVPASGELVVEVANPMISLVKDQPNSVFDADGSALVVHAGPDDYKTDPAGNAGDRIACGVIVE